MAYFIYNFTENSIFIEQYFPFRCLFNLIEIYCFIIRVYMTFKNYTGYKSLRNYSNNAGLAS